MKWAQNEQRGTNKQWRTWRKGVRVQTNRVWRRGVGPASQRNWLLWKMEGWDCEERARGVENMQVFHSSRNHVFFYAQHKCQMQQGSVCSHTFLFPHSIFLGRDRNYTAAETLEPPFDQLSLFIFPSPIKYFLNVRGSLTWHLIMYETQSLLGPPDHWVQDIS